MRTSWRRLLALVRRARLERELDEEVKLHLAMLEEEFRGRGLDSRAAKEAAGREFGGVAQMKEEYRDRLGFPRLESVAKDVRYAARTLARSPGFTAAAVASLALGIGATTAIFSLFNALMLRMLPVERPSELVSLFRTGGWGRGFASYPLYLEMAARKDLFTGVLARGGAVKVRFSAAGGGGAEFVSREFVSGGYFDVLGVKPELGRLISEEDNRTPKGHPVAVLSYDFWRSRFGCDQRVIGRSIVVDEQPLTVIGVARAGFRGVEVDHRPDLWVPAAMNRWGIMNPRMHWVWILARRRPELAKSEIQAAVDVIVARHLASVFGSAPDTPWRRRAMEQRVEVREGGIGVSRLREQFATPLAVLLAAVGLVLLAACVNVANLLLARAAARRKETGLRYALGATRGRLIRQWLIEGLLLGSLGSLLGLLLANWGARSLVLFLPAEPGESLEVAVDATVLGFTAAVSILSVVLFALVPALRATSIAPGAAIKEGSLQPAGRRMRIGLRQSLVIAQVALSVVLVVLAGLFAHSLAALRWVDPGFRHHNVLGFELDFPHAWKGAEKSRFRERLLARVSSLPGVVSSSHGAPGPYQHGFWNSGIRVPGSARTASQPASVAMQAVGPRYFETIGSGVVRGREFGAGDTGAARKVAVVNEAFVREFLPGQADPIGRVISFDDTKPEGGEPAFVVGVVRDILHQGVRRTAEPTVYLPAPQADNPNFEPLMVVLSGVPPATLLPMIRRELNGLDPEVALVRPATVRQQIDRSIFLERMVATLSGIFAGLALLLAAVGLYGAMGYQVGLRTAEIGIRMALGADAGKVQWSVLREALLLVGLGTAIGLPLALVAGRIGASLLYGIQPSHPPTFLLTVCVLFGTGIAAALLPARRAASVDPVQALRHE